MDYKKLIIRGISYSQTQAGAYALLLENPETSVKLPVVIGSFEAQSISIGLEKDITPPRPLTHDLFSKFVKETHYKLNSVIIYQILDGVFFSNLLFKNTQTQQEIILDARTSDAVAMAVRFDAPIYTTQQVLNEAGILLELDETPLKDMIVEEDKEISFEIKASDFMDMTSPELQLILEEAIKEEDYDLAMEVQEELNKRKKKID